MTPALISRLYLSAWLLLSAVAAGYFYFLYYTASASRVAHSSPPAPTQPAIRDNTTASRKASLKQSTGPAIAREMANMRMEINRLKRSLKTMGIENAALKEHVINLETAFGPTTASLPREQEKIQLKKMKAQAKNRATPVPQVDITMSPLPVDEFAVIDIPPSPLPIARASSPTRTLFAVQLAKTIEPGKTGARWAALQKQHAGILGLLEPRTVKVSSKNRRKKTVTLIAGPFTNVAAAVRACARLIAAGTKCKSTLFTGVPIGKVATR